MEWLSSVTGLLTVFGAVVGAFYLYRNVAATDSRAQLDAKDGALVTQKQVIQAKKYDLANLRLPLRNWTGKTATSDPRLKYLSSIRHRKP